VVSVLDPTNAVNFFASGLISSRAAELIATLLMPLCPIETLSAYFRRASHELKTCQDGQA
jgi:hypothetical protein